MIIQDRLGNVYYVDEDEVQRGDEMGLYGSVEQDNMDFIGYENLFHSLPREQLEVMICLFLGMKPVEIAKEFKYKNIARFYSINSRLRKSYQERKEEFMV